MVKAMHWSRRTALAIPPSMTMSKRNPKRPKRNPPKDELKKQLEEAVRNTRKQG